MVVELGRRCSAQKPQTLNTPLPVRRMPLIGRPPILIDRIGVSPRFDARLVYRVAFIAERLQIARIPE